MFASAADLLDFVLPRDCVGCRARGTALCATCAEPHPRLADVAGLRVSAAADYDGAVRTALLAYKERGRRDLAPPLRTLLASAIDALDQPDAFLVPVPSAAAARRARGGDHVARLLPRGRRARTALRLARAVRDSAGLDVNARAANLAMALRASSAPWPGASAVVVDDIVTSGATLTEAVRALRAAGWTVPGAAVVAATQRRFPGRSGRPQRVLHIPTAATPGTSRHSGLTWQ